MKTPLALAGAMLLVSSLAACGGDGDSAYCQEVESAATTFEDLDDGDAAVLGDVFSEFHTLAAEAPGDVKADWKVLEDGITGVENALDEAGITIADVAKIQGNELPEGADPTKLQGVATSFTALSDEKFSDAADNIQVHAKEVCDVELK